MPTLKRYDFSCIFQRELINIRFVLRFENTNFLAPEWMIVQIKLC